MSTKLQWWLGPILLLPLLTVSSQTNHVVAPGGKVVLPINTGWQFREAGKADWYKATEILLDSERIGFPVCDQYEIQGSLFSQALREHREQSIPLKDAISNMAVIDAVFRSETTGQWEDIQ